MSERETLAEAIAAEFERVHRQAGFGYMPAPKETERVALSWLAGVLADDATVEVVARVQEAHTWWIGAHGGLRCTCGDGLRSPASMLRPTLDDFFAHQRTVLLAALSAHLAPARDGDTSGEDGL